MIRCNNLKLHVNKNNMIYPYLLVVIEIISIKR